MEFRLRHGHFGVATIIFFLVCAWTIFLVQALPAGDLDDWDKIILSREMPWGQFAKSFFTPWSQSHNWVGQTDRDDEVYYKRIAMPMLLKLSQQWFGLSSFGFYVTTKLLFFAGSVTVVFLLMAQVVPLLFAILGALVFLFVPAHYSHALWIADPATIAYFFLFLGLLLFSIIIRQPLEAQPPRRFWTFLGGMFIAGWFGIRTKELLLVLPLTVFLYSMLNFRYWKLNPIRWLALNVAMAVIAFQIVPILHLTTSGASALQFNPSTLLRMLFFNYECGYDNEVRSAFFSFAHVFPVSIARTLGIFLLWAGGISTVVYIWRRWIKPDGSMRRFLASPVITVSVIWFLVELPFFTMFQPDPRYFSGTMAPLVVLMARLFYCVLSGKRNWYKILLAGLLVGGLSFNIVENIQHSISLRIMIGKRMNYFWNTAAYILADLKNISNPERLDVANFYAPINCSRSGMDTIDDHIYYVDLGFDMWNKIPSEKDTIVDFREKAGKGFIYYATFKELDLANFPDISLVSIVDGRNHSSVFEKVVFAKKKKRPALLRVYKCQPDSVRGKGHNLISDGESNSS
ncbi:MAG: hypothetical protein BWY44_01143 [Candidatus Omnitrophica bacterium ADurb.Bin292]|nr:MAG: hypothetical protein BWY44_01143 [Candidatus Omnitrophica bacterium ADurb.Bin292]